MLKTDNLFCSSKLAGQCECTTGCNIDPKYIQWWYRKNEKGILVAVQAKGEKVRIINLHAEDPRDAGVKVSLAIAYKHFFNKESLADTWAEIHVMTFDEREWYRHELRKEGYDVMSLGEERLHQYSSYDKTLPAIEQPKLLSPPKKDFGSSNIYASPASTPVVNDWPIIPECGKDCDGPNYEADNPKEEKQQVTRYIPPEKPALQAE